ncbi:hypothetical protein ScPMuIL_008627 [Solemya velum]
MTSNQEVRHPIREYDIQSGSMTSNQGVRHPIMSTTSNQGVRHPIREYVIQSGSTTSNQGYIEPKPGDFVDIENGQVVGKHQGTHYWTVGQRALIGGLRHAYFVVDVCPDTRTVTVAPGTDHSALFTDYFHTDLPYWIHGPPSIFSQTQTLDTEFRFQHKHPLVSCRMQVSGSDGLIVRLERPMRALTPGQFAAFYSDDECLGSARITKPGTSLFSRNQLERKLLRIRHYVWLCAAVRLMIHLSVGPCGVQYELTLLPERGGHLFRYCAILYRRVNTSSPV